jgi:hypothetical protein
MVTNMKLIEKKVNLFEVEDKYYFAHCISADAGTDNRAMGLGIVLEFNKRFHMKSKIQQYAKTKQISVGDSILIDKVFNLITKSKYYGKPTYDTLTKSLINMKEICVQENIKYLAMPKIGCGLDKLSYSKVKEIIKDIFNDTDIEILVCYL